MSTLSVARRPETWLVSLVALFTSCVAYVMDWNITHIYNPAWPPHAKFHNGQTMSMGLLLGLLGLWFVWRRPDEPGRFTAALLFTGLYRVTQASATPYPGAATIDPQFRATAVWQVGGIPVQILVDIVALALLGFAAMIHARRSAVR